jgi:hypothetical protein
MVRFDPVIKRYPDGAVAHGAGRMGWHAATNDCPPGAAEHASSW